MSGIVHDSHVLVRETTRDHEIDAYVQFTNDFVESIGCLVERADLFLLTISQFGLFDELV